MSLIRLQPALVQPADDVSDHLLRALTPRERQVALAVAAGASNRQVATALSMAPRTVECHLAHIYTKLGIASRVQLAVVLGTPSTGIIGSTWSSLTTMEREVAVLVGAGMSNRLAAKLLHLSPKTVEFYLGRIYRKLRITSRCQLPGVLASRSSEGSAERQLG
jgi:DNA-binding CsgD family transcriptional regulator